LQSQSAHITCIAMIEFGRRIRNHISALTDLLHRPFGRYIPLETFRYGATGGANTMLDIFLYFVCYNFVLKKELVHLPWVTISPHIAAFLIVFPITFVTGFILAKYITFTTSLFRGRKQLFRYGVTVAGAILLNYLLLKLFVEVLLIYPTPSKAITTLFVVAYSYMMQRYFSFQTGYIRRRNRQES
jgi:putative flippase GtrA